MSFNAGVEFDRRGLGGKLNSIFEGIDFAFFNKFGSFLVFFAPSFNFWADDRSGTFWFFLGLGGFSLGFSFLALFFGLDFFDVLFRLFTGLSKVLFFLGFGLAGLGRLALDVDGLRVFDFFFRSFSSSFDGLSSVAFLVAIDIILSVVVTRKMRSQPDLIMDLL